MNQQLRVPAERDLNDLFDDFFGSDDSRDYSLCTCGKPHNKARYLYTTDDGDAVWICAECAEQRDAESAARVENEARRSFLADEHDRLFG